MLKKILLGGLGFIIIGVAAFYFWPQPKYAPGQPSEVFLKNAESFYVAPLPPDWAFKDFFTANGRRIRWGETGNRNAAKASVVFVPGFGGFMEMYGEQVDMLAERGFHVISFEARGMGGGDRDNPKQPEQMNPSDFKIYSDDFAAFYKAHVSDLPQDKAVLALSFGAHLSMRAAAEHNLDVDAFVSAAPALRLQTGTDMTREEAVKGLGLLRSLGRGEYFLPGTGNWLPYSDDLIAVKECGSEPKRLFRRDVVLASRLDLRTGGPTVNWVLELDKSGSGYMASQAFKTAFNMPSKVLLADGDTIIDNDYAKAICQDIESCKLEVLPKTGHCLLVERDETLNRIFDNLDELLEK